MPEVELISLSKQDNHAAIAELFRRLDHFRGDALFKTWISRMVVNCCLLQIREARRRGSWVQLEGQGGQHHTDRLPSSLPTPEKYTWGREIAAALSYALARLPKHLRETYTLFTEAEMSLHEVASTMGLSLSATKTRIFRARAGLRTSLQPVWAGRRARTPASS